MSAARLAGPSVDSPASTFVDLTVSIKGAWATARDRILLQFGWRERRFVLQASRDMLELHRIVLAGRPGIARRELYATVVMVRTGAGCEEAEAILERAEQSFASWPAAHPLTFRDVVHYLLVTEVLRSEGEPSTRTDMGALIADRIPCDL